jgi:hypothetical protein
MTHLSTFFQCLVLIAFCVVATDCVAQQRDVPSGVVVFDPLFWKHQLKLDVWQCKKIREINSEYYSKLLVVAKDESSSRNLRAFAAESLRERSREIWEVFHPKQRKRWKKLWEEHYGSYGAGNS